MLTVVAEGCPDHDGARAGATSLIDGIVREGTRRMLTEATPPPVNLGAQAGPTIKFLGIWLACWPAARGGQ